MAKLFKQVPDEVRKSKSILIRVSEKEFEAIGASALIRNLSVAEFVRRAALGRKADVHFETEIVLALREVVQAIRKVYAAFMDKGIVPPVEEWRPVMKEAMNAMLRISK